MKYYSFHIGDYRRDTHHLSHEEHYIYRTLIDFYYESEQPLPPDTRVLLRRVGLTTDQLNLLENVLGDFFVATEKGYKHPRIEEELEKIYQKSEKARESAMKRWGKHANASNNDANAMRTHSERNAIGMLELCEVDANGMLPINPLTQEPINPIKNISPSGESGNSKSSPIPYQKIIDLYHKHCPKFPKVVKLSSKRKAAIRARWHDDADNLEFWEEYFKHSAKSKFLNGDNDRHWRADIDFLISERAIIGMQEGKYHG